MGRGGYRGASTIVIPGSRKWQSEEFYALPLEPNWKKKIQKAAAQTDAKKIVPEKHIFEGEVLRQAIMARSPALLEETQELAEARRHCPKNVGIFKIWLTQVASPFVPLPKGQFIKFCWKKAATLARQLGLRPFWPPKRKELSEGDLELLKRVSKSAAQALKESYPQNALIPVIYIEDE